MSDLRPRYSAAEFAELVQRETERVELKSGMRGKALQEAMVALSNSDGGVIFLGVREDRTVVGMPLNQGVEDGVHDAAHDAHDVGRIEIVPITVGRTPVVAVRVAPRVDGFAQTSDGRVLVRRGARNRALIGDELWRWISARSLRRFETSGSGVLLDACEPELLSEVSNAHGWRADASDLPARLLERGLLTGAGELTIVGALLLTNPGTTLGVGKFSVDVRGYEDDGATQFVRRDIVDGPVQRQLQEAAALVIRDLGQDQVVVRIHRHELPRIPPSVVREALANAVAHRSYEESGSAIVVEIRPRRLVIRSPGSLPEGVDVQHLRQAQRARNPVLIDVLRRLKLAEDSGLGVDLMEDQMRAAFLRDPHFEDDGHHVTVTLPRDPVITPQERAWVEELEAEGALGPAERALLVQAARGVVLTNGLARKITQIDSTEARRALHRLRDRGLLVQHGSRGGATYTLGRIESPGAEPSSRDSETAVLEEAARRPLTNALVRQLTGLDRSTATALLRRLVREGRLVQHGVRRGTTYTSPTSNSVTGFHRAPRPR